MHHPAVAVSTNGATRIEFITDKGIADTVAGPEGVYSLPADPDARPAFVRVKAYDDHGEILFSQPTLYRKATP